jgi:hypothetical protein
MGAVHSLAGETADVGMDAYSPVTDDYDPWDNALTGTITKVVVKLTADEGHHTPSPTARLPEREQGRTPALELVT